MCIVYILCFRFQESGVPLDERCKQQFMGMNVIFDALKLKNYAPALEWAAEHQEALERHGSGVEFALHK